MKPRQYRWLTALLLAIFIVMAVLGADEYQVIQMIVRIICTSCVGLGG